MEESKLCWFLSSNFCQAQITTGSTSRKALFPNVCLANWRALLQLAFICTSGRGWVAGCAAPRAEGGTRVAKTGESAQPQRKSLILLRKPHSEKNRGTGFMCSEHIVSRRFHILECGGLGRRRWSGGGPGHSSAGGCTTSARGCAPRHFVCSLSRRDDGLRRASRRPVRERCWCTADRTPPASRSARTTFQMCCPTRAPIHPCDRSDNLLLFWNRLLTGN